MIKIKEKNQSYTMEEIKAIVDELYPFGEYELNDKGEADANPAYCDKEDLLNLFLLLNKCNKKLAFSPIPLRAREKKQLIEERDNIYKQLQEKLNPEALQLSEEKEPQQVTINFYQNNYIQKNYTQNNNTQNNYSYAYTQSQKEDDSEIKEPQQDKHNRLITITDESLEEFRVFFIPAFKGMGNNIPDRFTQNLIPELTECFTKIEVAKLLYACYNSKCFNKRNGKKKISWNKFKNRFCLLFSIDKLPYKPNELGEPDYEKYYWLEPPKNRQ